MGLCRRPAGCEIYQEAGEAGCAPAFFFGEDLTAKNAKDSQRTRRVELVSGQGFRLQEKQVFRCAQNDKLSREETRRRNPEDGNEKTESRRRKRADGIQKTESRTWDQNAQLGVARAADF